MSLGLSKGEEEKQDGRKGISRDLWARCMQDALIGLVYCESQKLCPIAVQNMAQSLMKRLKERHKKTFKCVSRDDVGMGRVLLVPRDTPQGKFCRV